MADFYPIKLSTVVSFAVQQKTLLSRRFGGKMVSAISETTLGYGLALILWQGLLPPDVAEDRDSETVNHPHRNSRCGEAMLFREHICLSKASVGFSR